MPPGGLRSERIARIERANGVQEVTEYEGRGEYRVTRCARDGLLIVSQTVSVIYAPGGGNARVPTTVATPQRTTFLLYSDPRDPVWSRVFSAQRERLRAQTIPPTRPTPERPALADPRLPDQSSGVAVPQSAAAIEGCKTTHFTPSDRTWVTRNYNYRVNRGRFGDNPKTISAIVRGHTTWDKTRNGCGYSDITNLGSHYLGNTSSFADLFDSDGKSVVDKGPLTGLCSSPIACTTQAPNADATAGGETDTRIGNRYRFSTTGVPGTYDYEAVVTHETGHSIGLADSSQSKWLTMYHQSFFGATFHRTLARGDVRGLRARYP